MLENDYLTVPDFARRLGISRITVYVALNADPPRVEHTKVLGRILIPRTELKRFKKRRNGNKSKVLKAA